jgi:hypothetical protein
LPLEVYRYLRPEILEEFLEAYLLHSFFWLRSPSDFNDPFDTSTDLALGSDIEARRKRYKELAKRHMPGVKWKMRKKDVEARMFDPEGQLSILRNSFDKHLKRLGILCLSEDNLNLLMWSHYADNHKGFALRFDLAHDLKTMLRISKVEYSTDYPLVNWSELEHDDIKTVFLRKYDGWKYEREWRMVIPNGAHTYLPFKPSAVTGLIFGCRAEDPLKHRILTILQKRAAAGLPPLEIFKAVKHKREYRLTIESDASLAWPSK